jgi:hypothetical protein
MSCSGLKGMIDALSLRGSFLGIGPIDKKYRISRCLTRWQNPAMARDDEME